MQPLIITCLHQCFFNSFSKRAISCKLHKYWQLESNLSATRTIYSASQAGFDRTNLLFGPTESKLILWRRHYRLKKNEREQKKRQKKKALFTLVQTGTSQEICRDRGSDSTAWAWKWQAKRASRRRQREESRASMINQGEMSNVSSRADKTPLRWGGKVIEI